MTASAPASAESVENVASCTLVSAIHDQFWQTRGTEPHPKAQAQGHDDVFGMSAASQGGPEV